MDITAARQMILVIMLVFALGYAVLLSLTPMKTGGIPQFDSNSITLINFGTAIASYLVQRPKFLEWKNTHKRTRPGSVVSAIAIAALYTVLISVVASISYFVVQLVMGSGA